MPRDFSKDQIEAVQDALRRMQRALTQKQIAELIGTDQSTISGILSGRQGVRHALAERIALLSGMTLAELFGTPLTKRRPFALEAAIAFAHANGIPKESTEDYEKFEAYPDGSAENIYFEIKSHHTRRLRGK